MNVAAMVTAISDDFSGRFNSSESTAIYNWINQAYSYIWAQHDWPWKKVLTTVSITSADNTPTMPTNFGGRVYGFWDDQGDRLTYMSEYDYLDAYTGTVVSGKPRAFTIIDGVVYLGPTPNSNFTANWLYERRPCVKDSGGTYQDRVFSVANSTDVPVFYDAWHHVLIAGAQAVGLRMANDPTYPMINEQFMMELTSMAENYLPPERATTLQYGPMEY